MIIRGAMEICGCSKYNITCRLKQQCWQCISFLVQFDAIFPLSCSYVSFRSAGGCADAPLTYNRAEKLHPLTVFEQKTEMHMCARWSHAPANWILQQASVKTWCVSYLFWSSLMSNSLCLLYSPSAGTKENPCFSIQSSSQSQNCWKALLSTHFLK